MPRKSNTSFNIRQLVIFHNAKGKSYRQIAAMLNVSKSTVADIVKRFKYDDRIDFIPQKGQPKKLDARDKRKLIRKIKKDPTLSAPKLAAELLNEAGKQVHPQTIRRALKENGYNGRVARKKPYVNEQNRKKRLNFAKEFILKEETWWNDVIFTDESKFNIFGSDGRRMVWRKKNEEFNFNNLRPTVKHGGGNVLVWGCISTFGPGELVFIDNIMDKNVYLNILKNNLHKSATQMGILNTFKFYQDNDPKHKARIVQEYLLYNCPKVLQPPPQSPDLNPIENAWDEIERRIRTTTISSKEMLKHRLKEEWDNISTEYCKKIISNMPQRLKEVIQQDGYPTRY